MINPQYLFLPDGQFVTALVNRENEELTLIHPFQDHLSIQLTGLFAKAIIDVVDGADNSGLKYKVQLEMIERQNPWLQGLVQASFFPSTVQALTVGSDLGLCFIELTDQCNERCIHCYASSSPDCHTFLGIEMVKRVLVKLKALGEPVVQFTGGDPLIHRNLVEAVAEAHQLGFAGIEIYTNGLLLSDKLLDELKSFSPMIAFSLYATNASIHDAITQVKGSFAKTIAAIHRAQSKGFQVRIGMAVMQENSAEQHLMPQFVYDEFGLGSEHIRFDPVHQTGRGNQLELAGVELLPWQNSHMPEKPENNSHKQEASGKGRRGKLAICANGDVTPCIFNRTQVLGNVKEQTLDEILNQAHTVKAEVSIERWNRCQQQLSCSDCRMVSYSLGGGDE